MKKKSYLVMSSTIIAALLIVASYANQHQLASSFSMAAAAATQTSPDYSLGAAGDWSTSTDARETAENMVSHHVQLALGLGDYAYAKGSDSVSSWWNDQMAPLNRTIFEGAMGNHDVSDSPTYVNKFGSANTGTWYYS